MIIIARCQDQLVKEAVQQARRRHQCPHYEPYRQLNITNSTVPAHRWQYEEWLSGFLFNGGRITHVYDYPWTRWRWLCAHRTFTIKPKYGSRAVNLIVPVGITISGDRGHSTLYFMDGFHTEDIVPLFADMWPEDQP